MGASGGAQARRTPPPRPLRSGDMLDSARHHRDPPAVRTGPGSDCRYCEFSRERFRLRKSSLEVGDPAGVELDFYGRIYDGGVKAELYFDAEKRARARIPNKFVVE